MAATLESLKDPRKRQVTPDRVERQEQAARALEEQKLRKTLNSAGGQTSQESGSDASDGEQNEDGELVHRPRKPRASMLRLQQMLPDAEEVLERMRGGMSGFSDSEMERVNAAFDRHHTDHEVHKDELGTILEFLGYTQVDRELVKTMVGGITEYSTLEKHDFVTFVAHYAQHEVKHFREIFETFDDDGNGTLDQDELIKLLAHLGFTPLRKMVREALNLVDLDHTGVLTFDQMVLLLHVYRHSEGFTKEEVNHLTEIYHKELAELEKIAREKEKESGKIVKKKIEITSLPATSLASVLLKFFGPAVAETAKELEKEVTSGKVPVETDGEKGGKGVVGLQLGETLLWARRLRDKEFESYRKAFHQYDTDGSGAIDLDELINAFHKLGYSLSKAIVKELIKEAQARGECNSVDGDPLLLDEIELDFDSFVHVMQILQETDGFSKKEMAELRASFLKFDEDNSDEIDVVELSDLFHYMGHTTQLDDMQLLINKVDFNGNGVLDSREFLRLMRLHKEEQLSGCKTSFETFADVSTGKISLEDLKEALETCCPPQEADSNDEAHMPKEPVDFDGFVEVVDTIREIRVAYLRKRAGFSDAEIRRFEKLFKAYDAKNAGILEMQMVTRLLGDLGVKVRSREEQDDVVKQIEKSRVAAADRGACTLAPPGSPVNFWVVVQMMREIRKRDDKHTLNKTAKAAAQARFSNQEVEQFREVFTSTWEKDRFFEEDADRDEGHHEEEGDEDKREITKTSLRRLLRSLGVSLDGNLRGELDAKIETFGKSDRVDFADFLTLMRWMMDTNFGGITGAAAKNSGK
jgi:Ca2+-binding EF-hand superfamily protein